MRKTYLFGALIAFGFVLTGCTTAAITAKLATPAGQLYCEIATGGGDTILAGVIDAAASAVPGAGAVAVIATGATSAAVQADCAAAAKAVGGTAGVPISPPATPVGNVAITPAT
jgi:hypothetical protein